MNGQLVTLLLKLGELALPVLVDFLDALVDRFREGSLQDDDLSVALRIVTGIERAHPDWDGPTKAHTAREAIRAHLGPGTSDSAVNLILELAVTRAKV